MTNTASALYAFWSGFGIPAYLENTVPDEATLPYITYNLIETESTEPSTHYAQIFYRDTSNVSILAKVDAIRAEIGQGKLLPCTGGYIMLRQSNPFVQMIIGEDPAEKRAYLNLQINCFHL